MEYMDPDSNPHEHLIKYIKKPLVILRIFAVVSSNLSVNILTLLLNPGLLHHCIRVHHKPGLEVGP